MSSNSIPILSFFSGAGGLDLGFRRAGFNTLLALDKDPAAIESLNANLDGKPGIVADLFDIGVSHIEKAIGSRHLKERPRGIIGGPPCQGFSNGNVVLTPRDPRNRLPAVYAKLLGDLNRKFDLDFFVFENVTGLLRRRHRDRLGKLRAAFRAAGFRIFESEVNAQDFGLPQVRKRLFLVGLNAKRWPDTTFTFPVGKSAPKTVADAIRGLPPPVFFRHDLGPEDVPFHHNHWTMQPKSPRFTSGNFNRWRSFRRLEWDAPSPTVAYGNREIHVHPDGTRRLSVLEAMLLQGFPQSYVLHGNLSQQVTQVSNAVPPPVAHALAISLRDLLLKHPNVAQKQHQTRKAISGRARRTT